MQNACNNYCCLEVAFLLLVSRVALPTSTRFGGLPGLRTTTSSKSPACIINAPPNTLAGSLPDFTNCCTRRTLTFNRLAASAEVSGSMRLLYTRGKCTSMRKICVD